MRQFIQFLSLLLFSGTLIFAEPSSSAKTSSSATATVKKDSVLLKLLEPIAPQAIKDPHKKDKKGEEIEIVHSNLGELLKDPKNENLKDVKVVGKQRRLKTDTENFTIIRWEEVALETNKIGQDGTVESGGGEFVKEPVEKPLESSFIQTSESIAPGTPIEAAGDSQSLLAAARTLMIKVQKGGGKAEAVKSPPTASKIEGKSKVSDLMTPEGMNSQGGDESTASSSQNSGQDFSTSPSAGQGGNPSTNGYQGGQSSSQPSFSGGGGSSGGRVSNRGGLGFNNGNPYQVAEREKREAAEREKREAELRAAQSQNAQQPQIVVNTGNNPAQQGQNQDGNVAQRGERGGQEEQANPAAQNGRVENRDGAGNAERNAPQNPAVNPAANGRDGNPERNGVPNPAHNPAAQNGRGNNPSSPIKPRLPIDAANPEARRGLGNLYSEGGIVNKDSARASKMYTKASDAGDIPSTVSLGEIEEAKGNIEGAIKYYLIAAKKNDAAAQYKLSVLLESKGSSQDRKDAATWRSRAAQTVQQQDKESVRIVKGLNQEALNNLAQGVQANNPNAQRALGMALLEGIGVEQNEARGVELLTKAANQGDTKSMTVLGYYFKAKEPKKSFEYFLRASKKEEGRTPSQSSPLDKLVFNLEAKKRYTQVFELHGPKPSSPPDLKDIERDAHNGNPVALRKLGQIYNLGVLVPKNPAKAREYFLKAAEKQDSQALVNLGDMALSQNNIADAIKYYRLSAVKNNPTGQIKLADLLAEHPRSPSDQAEAESLRKAAAANAQKLQESLNTTLEITPAVVQKFLIQAKQGDKRSQVALAILYAKGQGVEKNAEKAADLLEQAAKQGDVNAQVLLSNASQKGKGIAHDSKRAVDLLEQAVRGQSTAGDETIPEQAKAAREDWRHYQKALEESEKKKTFFLSGPSKRPSQFFNLNGPGRKEGEEELEGKAHGGDAVAQRKLAYFYVQSRKKDKAVHWYTLSAQQGDAASQVALGDAYMKGDGVTFNPSTALELYSKAAHQDDSEGMLKLSQLLDGGIGCPRDAKSAEKWRQKAAETAQKKREVLASRSELTEEAYKVMVEKALADHPGAQTSLGILTSKKAEGNKEDNQKDGLEWVKEAAEQGDLKAQVLVANSLIKGKGTETDLEKAVLILKNAAKNEGNVPHRPATETEQDKDNRESLRRYHKALAVLEKRADKGKGRVDVDSDDEGYESDNQSESEASGSYHDSQSDRDDSESDPINISSSSGSSSAPRPAEDDSDDEGNPWTQFKWKNPPHEGGNGVDPFLAHQGKDRKDIDPKSTERTFEDGEENKDANITIEYDLKNSLYETDFDKKEVRQVAKMLTFQEGKLIETSKDYAVIKSFKIQKDYNHSECQDYVEMKDNPRPGENLGFAYATYRPFWINESKEKIYLKGPEPDKDHPMALSQEEGKCSYSLDFTAMKAASQSEIVYTNRLGERVVYQDCRTSASSKVVPITITQQGCKPLHDMRKGVSYLQQRFIYTLNGVQHEALECHRSLKDEGVKHKFEFCKPIVDEVTKIQQPMAKRVVTLTKDNKPWKIELSECVKHGNQTPLLFDTAVCAEQPYHHDFERGHSYVRGRWYYNRPQGEGFPPKKKYFGVCQAGPTAYPHQPQISYENEDAKKCSYPMTKWIIKAPKEIEVKTGVVDRSKPQPYLKLRERTQAYPSERLNANETEQRFAVFTVYKRADGTSYEEASGDMRERTVETSQYIGITHFSHHPIAAGGGKPWEGGYIKFIPDNGTGWQNSAARLRMSRLVGFIWPTYKITQTITRSYSDIKKSTETRQRILYRFDTPVTLPHTSTQPPFAKEDWEEADWKAQME